MVVNIHDRGFGDRVPNMTPQCKTQEINTYTHKQIETLIYTHIQHIPSQLKLGASKDTKWESYMQAIYLTLF